MPSKAATIEAYRAMTLAQRERTAATVGSVWLSMDSWSDAAAKRMLAQVVPVVIGGQQATATATAAYLQAMTGTKVGKLDMSKLTGAAVRNGVSPMDVYMRAVVKARVTYSRSDLVELAVNEGMKQLMGSVSIDLQRTATRTAAETLSRAGVGNYRRATRAGACPLCVAASDNVYSTSELLPIHTHCGCVVVPGAKLPKGLQRAGNATDPLDGRGLIVDDNGEIGPVLDYADRITQ